MADRAAGAPHRDPAAYRAVWRADRGRSRPLLARPRGPAEGLKLCLLRGIKAQPRVGPGKVHARDIGQ